MRNPKVFATGLILVILAIIESSVPYWYAQHQIAEGHVFLGQIISTYDQNMYFSFIRQAEKGAFLFRNDLTYIPHPALFINLEFWWVGRLQALTGLGENNLYTLWRILGVITLAAGFLRLAIAFGLDQRRLAFAGFLFLFSGGIGFFKVLLHAMGVHSLGAFDSLFGNNAPPNLAMDTASYLMPFNQIMTNPHFSLPTGMELFAYSLFLSGLANHKKQHFFLAGLLLFLMGFIRPYDLIPPMIVFPSFFLYKALKKEDMRGRWALYLFPVTAILPALIYNIWLFHFHPVFRYWSSQGDNAYMIPSFWVHWLNFGVIGVLALVRIFRAHRQRLQAEEVFLIILIVATFFCNHLGKYWSVTPWSFQIGAYLAAPMVLLGVNTDPAGWFPQKRFRLGIFGIIALIAIGSNLTLLFFRCKIIGDPANRTHMFARKGEYNAWMWLRHHTAAGDVLLSSTYTSGRIAKYTDLCVVAGHPFVSPDYRGVKARAERINLVNLGNYLPELDSFRVNYVYAGPEEAPGGPGRIEIPGHITTVYLADGVAIYKINRDSQ